MACPKFTPKALHQMDSHFKSKTLIFGGIVRTMLLVPSNFLHTGILLLLYTKWSPSKGKAKMTSGSSFGSPDNPPMRKASGATPSYVKFSMISDWESRRKTSPPTS